MSILGASFMPHPPIVIPEVGRGEEVKAEKTSAAMKKVGDEINQLGPETIVIISPHGYLQPEKVGWAANSMLIGDMGNFGAPEVSFEYKNDSEVTDLLCSELAGTQGYEHPGDSAILDHGALVPLYFVNSDIRHNLVYGGYSFRDATFHFNYGKNLAELIKTVDRQLYIIASGDLSHRLTPQAPAGYDPRAQEFDDLMATITHDNNWEAITKVSPTLIEKAGECGFRSLAIFAGIIRGLEMTVDVLSYEAPFGVGYMVAKA